MTRHALTLLLVVALGLTACAQAEVLPADVDVVVNLTDYKVTLSATSMPAGTINFGIRNQAAMEHEFQLLRTTLAPDKLAVDTAQAKARQDGLVKEVKGIRAGKVATVSAELTTGNYVIICNVAGHYQLGMRVDFTVV